MYLWNRIYAVRGAGTCDFFKGFFKTLGSSDHYFRKYIVLDGTSSTSSRREIYPEYKTNRNDKTKLYKYMNDTLSECFALTEGCKIISNENCEADDVITMMVAHYPNVEKYIYSGDTDLHQLLKFPNTFISDKYTGAMVLKPIAVKDALSRYEKKYNIRMRRPSDITKCKMFKGDAGDNIPVACPGLRSSTIEKLLDNCWSGDEPLSPNILKSMSAYLKEHGTDKEYNNFFRNRPTLIMNYKLTQLGDIQNNKVLAGLKLLRQKEGKLLWE